MSTTQTTLAGRFVLADVRLTADCFGSPSGRPILFAHGGGQTRHSWGGAASALADDGYWSVSVDLRGHGESEWAADGDYSFIGYARDLTELSAALPRPPIIVGASVGGLAGLLAIGELGARAAGLVLVDVVPAPARVGSERVMSFMRSGLDGFDSVDEAADAVAAYLPHRERPRDPKGLRKNLRLRADGRLAWHWDPAVVAVDRIPTPADVERFYRAAAVIEVPSLLLRGQRSEIVGADNSDDLLAVNPTFELEEIPAAGHMIAGDRNDHFTDALTRFMRRNFPVLATDG